MNTDVVIECKSLAKNYSGKDLFSDISFCLKSGECLAVRGANGSGKSTLLKMIAGVIKPTAGSISISYQGTCLDEQKRVSILGMVSPEMQMYDSLSGVENIVYLAGAKGITVSRRQVTLALSMLGLADEGKALTRMYSTGMKQRLKMALLVCINAPLWILDEPSSNMDQEGKNLVNTLVNMAVRGGKTVILASNDAKELEHAHKTICLS